MLELLDIYRESIAGAMIISLVCSVVGVYVVLRRVVFVGAALAQLSSAGLALASFLASFGVGLGVLTDRFVLALGVTLAGVVLFALQGARRRVPPDAGLGMAFVLAGAFTVLLVARSATADIHDLFFGGDVLLMAPGEVIRLAAVGGPVLLLIGALGKELTFVSFDPEMASTLGYRTRRWDLLLYACVAAVITLSMESAGVLLVFSYLVLPPVAGLLLGRSLRGVFAWSAVAGVAGTTVGFGASLHFDLPSGATVILALGVLTVVAWAARELREGAPT